MNDNYYSLANHSNVPKGTRFVNYLVDGIVVYVLDTVLSKILLPSYDPSDLEAMMSALPAIIGLNLLIFVAYYVGMEASGGRTVGKFLTNTKTIDLNGNQPDAGTIVKRSLIRIIPFEPFSYLFGNDNMGWHDRWSGTRVVKLTENTANANPSDIR